MSTIAQDHRGRQGPYGHYDPDALHRENVKLRTEVLELRAVVKQQQEQLARYRDQQAMLRNVNRSSGTPADKLLIPYILQQMASSDADVKDGHVHICHQTAAKALGLNPNTVGLGLATWVSTGGLTRITERRQDQEGNWYDAGRYAPVPDVLKVVHTLPKEALKAVRAKRYKCRECGSEDVTVSHTISCHTCHAVYDTYSQRQPPSNAPEQENPGDLHFVDRDFGEADPENEDVLKQEAPPTSPGGDDPAVADVPPWVGTDEDARKWTAALFQSLAGDGPHIVMQPTGPNKYIELKEPLSLSCCLDHLAGGRARGLKQRKDAPWTRGLIFDVDGEEEARPLRMAGVKLAAAGYRVLWQTSPSKDHAGGGHLILLFDALVPTSAAYAHAYSLAPELQTIAEHWPRSKNMRLPGGYYKRPDASGWCTLISINTGEMAAQGAAAWRMLLSHQTRASIVPELPPEPPAPEPERPAPKPRPASPIGGTVEFDGKEAIAWWNGQGTLDDILPRSTATHALAIWRGEKAASVQYNASGLAYDYGTNETLDRFELYCRVHGLDKAFFLREVMRQYRAHLLAG